MFTVLLVAVVMAMMLVVVAASAFAQNDQYQYDQYQDTPAVTGQYQDQYQYAQTPTGGTEIEIEDEPALTAEDEEAPIGIVDNLIDILTLSLCLANPKFCGEGVSIFLNPALICANNPALCSDEELEQA